MTNWYHEAGQAVGEIATAVQDYRSISLERLEALAEHVVSSLQRNDELVVEALAGPAGPPTLAASAVSLAANCSCKGTW